MKLIKYIIGALLLIALILYIKTKYIKIIPNYSKSSGTEWVLNSNYKKYQDGYCLDENRILSDEEIFKRGIMEYIHKKSLFEMKVYWYYENADYSSSAYKPKYYFSIDKNLSELQKISFNMHDYKEFSRQLKENFREINITDSELNKFLEVDLESMSAGFSFPLLEWSPFNNGSYDLYPNKSFLFKLEKEGKIKKNIFLVNTINIDNLKSEHNAYYYETISKHRNSLLEKWVWDSKSFLSLSVVWEIDNCGHINFNVEKEYENIEPHIGQAG